MVSAGTTYNVSGWKNIVAISAGGGCSLGLKSDGTVVAVGSNYFGECDVSQWEDIVAISASSDHSLGLKSDGTVVAVGSNSFGQCDVSKWTDIIAISAGFSHSLGLKSDGTVVATGNNEQFQCDVTTWKLFNNLATLEKERKTAIEQEEQRQLQSNRRQQGVCQHCGGAFKGLFTKKCSDCGIEKDY